MSEKLKACPFCGGVAVLYITGNGCAGNMVQCSVCSSTGANCIAKYLPHKNRYENTEETTSKAIAAWNKRTNER